MDYAALIGGLVNAGLQIYSTLSNQDDAAKKKAELMGAYNRLKVAYENGQIDPTQFKDGMFEVLGASPVTASLVRGNQMDALRQLSDVGSSNGMDAQTAENDAVEGQKYAQATGAAQQAIADKYQRQGKWGSGGELAAQLQGGQSAANALRASGVQSAAAARQRALQAISQSGQLSSQIRGQDESLASGNRDAENARQQFNSRMRMAAAGMRNDATKYNNQLAGQEFDAAGTMNGLGRADRQESTANAARLGSNIQSAATQVGAGVDAISGRDSKTSNSSQYLGDAGNDKSAIDRAFDGSGLGADDSPWSKGNSRFA